MKPGGSTHESTPPNNLFARFIAASLLVLIALGVSEAVQTGQVPQVPAGAALLDPVALLNRKIERGEAKLRYTPERGYLSSVLKELGIPVSSQTLVFSRTSLQTDRISPSTPRAVYFNDDVYVGWIPDSPMLEVASVDPSYGTIFYTLPQSEVKTPSFARVEQPCLSCHGPVSESVPAPLLLMMSSEVGENGEEVKDFLLTTDRSPFLERWGGWYVSGTAGNTKHMGRKTPSNTKRYLAQHSDIVALMLLAHQAEVHNRIGEVSQKFRTSGGPGSLGDVVEPLVRTLLFSGEAALTAPIRGSSSFAAEFGRKGPRDRRGRSLRDLDLRVRLFRYPLSYLVYSESFRQMPGPARTYVYRRLREVLDGTDQSAAFRHLTSSDRTAVSEILTATLPEFSK
jgi:hypothetical protein